MFAGRFALTQLGNPGAASLSNIERRFDGSVDLFQLLYIAGSHEASHTVPGNRQEVVKICHALKRQSLPAAKDDLSRNPSYGSGHENDNDRIDGMEDRISRQDDNWPAPHR